MWIILETDYVCGIKDQLSLIFLMCFIILMVQKQKDKKLIKSGKDIFMPKFLHKQTIVIKKTH